MPAGPGQSAVQGTAPQSVVGVGLHLRLYVARLAIRDTGTRDGLSTDERERIKFLEREVKELRRANDIPSVRPDTHSLP